MWSVYEVHEERESGNSSKNIKLVKALESLKNVGVIYEYERYKSAETGRSICQIFRDEYKYKADKSEREQIAEKKNFLESVTNINCDEEELIKIPKDIMLV